MRPESSSSWARRSMPWRLGTPPSPLPTAGHQQLPVSVTGPLSAADPALGQRPPGHGSDSLARITPRRADPGTAPIAHLGAVTSLPVGLEQADRSNQVAPTRRRLTMVGSTQHPPPPVRVPARRRPASVVDLRPMRTARLPGTEGRCRLPLPPATPSPQRRPADRLAGARAPLPPRSSGLREGS